MHKEFAKDGLVVITVSVDDGKRKEKVQKVLEGQKLTCLNLLLDEKEADWTKKFKIDGPPYAILYNREGKVEKEYRDEVDHDDVEKVVKELLKKK